jgi:hypothetical protein
LSVAPPEQLVTQIADQPADLTPPAEPTAPAEAKARPAAGADSAAQAQQILDQAYAAMKSKKYDRVETLLEQARRLQRHAGKSAVSSEILYLQGMLFELRGQWREAMAAYTRYERIPSAQRKPQSAQAVAEAVAHLKPRMGHVLIYTMKNGQCEMTDDYYMPSGEHIISLGGGQSRAVTVDAGGTTPVRQCP